MILQQPPPPPRSSAPLPLPVRSPLSASITSLKTPSPSSPLHSYSSSSTIPSSPPTKPTRRTPDDFEHALLHHRDSNTGSGIPASSPGSSPPPLPPIAATYTSSKARLGQQSTTASHSTSSRATAAAPSTNPTATASPPAPATTTSSSPPTAPSTSNPTPSQLSAAPPPAGMNTVAAVAAASTYHRPGQVRTLSSGAAGPEAEMERRESVVSQDSAHSGGGRSSNGASTTQQRLQQRKMMLAQTQSLGLDAEIKAEDAAVVPKRRSIFRTSGTASTPDLSTLIRGKKQQKAAAASQDKASAAKNQMPYKSPQRSTSSSSRDAGGSGAHLTSSMSTSTSSLSPSVRRHGSERDNVHLQARGGAEWERTNSSQSHLHHYGNDRDRGMATISEAPAEQLARQPSVDESGKVKRVKGKGMFGRMFGGANNKEHGIYGPGLGSTSQLSLAGRSQVDVSSPPPTTSPTLSASPRFPGNQAFSFADTNGATSSNGSTRPPVPQRPAVPIVPKTAAAIDHPLPPPDPIVTPDTVIDFAAAPSSTTSDVSRAGMVSRSQTADHEKEPQTEEIMAEPSAVGRRPLNRSPSVSSATGSIGSIIDPGRPHVQRGDSGDAIATPHSRAASRRTTAEGGGSGGTSGSPRGHPGRNASSFSDDVTGLLDRISHGEPSAGGLVRGSPIPSTREPDVSEHLRVSPERSSSINSRFQLPYNDRSPTLGMTPRSNIGQDDTIVAEPLPVPSTPADSAGASPQSRSPVVPDEAPLEPLPVESEAAGDDVSESAVPMATVIVGAAGVATGAAVGGVAAAAAPNVRVSGPSVPSKRGSAWDKQQQQGLATADSSSSVRFDSESVTAVETTSSAGQSNVNLADIGETDEDKGRQLANEFYEGDPTHIPTDKVAIFLGGPKPLNGLTLYFYMQYFDMRNLRLDQAFRDLCGKLHLKAESQEIDRILEGFSGRYYECNPNTVFGTPGVVHTVTAAMLMLNTDLHIAELSKHMSRADFVRNAMRAIQESMPDRDASTLDLVNNDSGSLRNVDAMSAAQSTTSIRLRPTTSAQRTASGTLSPPASELTSPSLQDLRSRASSTTINSSFTYSRAWEQDAEVALKDIYANVRSDRILLPIGPLSEAERQTTSPLGGLSRVAGFSAAALGVKRAGKGNGPYNAMYNADGQLSPNASHPNSIGDVLAPALGFAGNLSHTVIKEQDDEAHSIHSQESSSSIEEMSVDELALLGAPWAKEGLLQRKVQVEALGKKAGKKDWKQFFVVIQKGDLHMFVFGSGGGGSSGGGFGGGNWMSSANRTGEYSLMHAMAMALPKPGYSAVRPHCFTVTFPTGEISVFQAGTEELVAEWVATCNYWAARRSRQPLVGGVSNMEYGWARCLSNADEDVEDRASLMSSTRMRGAYARVRGQNADKREMDRTHINEWKPPPHATIPSTLDEEAQLESLVSYVNSLMEELNQHKAVEEPMTRLYPNGSKNGVKARENWTAKSRYIHSEIFKYETYVEALRNAIQLRVQRQEERMVEQRAERKKQKAAAAAAAANGAV